MLFLAIALTLLLCIACYTDARKFVIPNWLSLAVIALWPLMLWLTPQGVDWQHHLLVLGITFACGFVLFLLKVMGGGDIKLIIALSLWLGTQAMLEFFIYMAVLGGVLALIALAGRKLAPWLAVKCGAKAGSIPRVFSDGQPLPYGIAIAIGFIIVLWLGRVPGIAFG